jgi:hypothetical protein
MLGNELRNMKKVNRMRVYFYIKSLLMQVDVLGLHHLFFVATVLIRSKTAYLIKIILKAWMFCVFLCDPKNAGYIWVQGYVDPKRDHAGRNLGLFAVVLTGSFPPSFVSWNSDNGSSSR